MSERKGRRGRGEYLVVEMHYEVAFATIEVLMSNALGLISGDNGDGAMSGLGLGLGLGRG